MPCAVGEIRNYKIQKRPQANCHFLGLGNKSKKARYQARSLHTAPQSGWADHRSYTSCPIHWSTATLTLFRKSAHATWRSKQSHLLLVFTPSCYIAQVLIKSCLNSHLVSYQFLMINGCKDPSQYQSCHENPQGFFQSQDVWLSQLERPFHTPGSGPLLYGRGSRPKEFQHVPHHLLNRAGDALLCR